MGCDESWLTEMNPSLLRDGSFPHETQEAMLTENARDMLGLRTGDTITVDTPDGEGLTFTVSGFVGNASKNSGEDSYGIVLSMDSFFSIYPAEKAESLTDYNTVLYVRFSNVFQIQNSISELKEQCGLSAGQISENAQLLALLGQGSAPVILYIYLSAAVLFVLVLTAGILMIAASLNSIVSQRTEFFGLLRCIGATPKQIMRLVRQEALGWCRLAIPASLALGTVTIWILCAALRFLSPEYFGALPVFSLKRPQSAHRDSRGNSDRASCRPRPGPKGGPGLSADCSFRRSRQLPAGPQSRRHQASSDRYCPGPSSRRRKQEKPVSHDRLLFPKHHPLSFLFRGCGFHESFSDSAAPMDSGHFHYQPGPDLLCGQRLSGDP